MKFDEYGLLISEEHDDSTENGFQGNRGEALATTGRWAHLYHSVAGAITFDNPLTPLFGEDDVYIRHPLSPWREKDETSDQITPVACFYKIKSGPRFRGLRHRLERYNWRTGNSDLVSVKLYALLTEKTWLLNASLVVQRLIFVVPIRYNEEKFNQKKWPIESSYNSSADWINVIHLLYYASPWVRRLYSKERLKERVGHYYSREKNCDWLLELYDRFIERL